MSKTSIDKQVEKFMKTVRDFLKKKNNGNIPEEWSLSLMMLKSYYRQFLMITDEIDNLESITVDSRYGKVASPLLTAQSTISVRLEHLMDSFGLTMKAASKMNIISPTEELSPLDAFVKNNIEKR